jgi:hypothetical protein
VPLLRPRTWAKLTIGVLVIGGILTVLWAVYDPSPLEPVRPRPTATAAPLRAARAGVAVVDGSGRLRRAAIRCDGDRRSASGFWAGRPGPACDALASARSALLSGPGCRSRQPGHARLRATGAFGSRTFDHSQQRGGCPDPDGWLAVNVLASPVVPPDREADKPGTS